MRSRSRTCASIAIWLWIAWQSFSFVRNAWRQTRRLITHLLVGTSIAEHASLARRYGRVPSFAVLWRCVNAPRTLRAILRACGIVQVYVGDLCVYLRMPLKLPDRVFPSSCHTGHVESSIAGLPTIPRPPPLDRPLTRNLYSARSADEYIIGYSQV